MGFNGNTWLSLYIFAFLLFAKEKSYTCWRHGTHSCYGPRLSSSLLSVVVFSTVFWGLCVSLPPPTSHSTTFPLKLFPPHLTLVRAGLSFAFSPLLSCGGQLVWQEKQRPMGRQQLKAWDLELWEPHKDAATPPLPSNQLMHSNWPTFVCSFKIECCVQRHFSTGWSRPNRWSRSCFDWLRAHIYIYIYM